MKMMKSTHDILSRIEKVLPAIVKTMQAMDNPQWSELYPTTSDFKDDIDKEYLYYFVEDDNIIGVAALVCEYDAWFYEGIHQNQIVPKNDEVLYVHRIFIFPEFTGKRFGEKIYQCIINYAKAVEKSAVQVDTHENNIPMNKTLRNSGFAYTGSHGREGRRGLWNMYEYVI